MCGEKLQKKLNIRPRVSVLQTPTRAEISHLAPHCVIMRGLKGLKNRKITHLQLKAA